jgi:ATP synthase protein I
VSAFDLPHARRLAFGVVLGQAVVTVIVALAAWGWAGRLAAISALLGGGISTAGSLAMALLGFRRPASAGGMSLLATLLVGEAAKFGVIVVLFVLVLTLMKISAVAMLATYAATFLVYWLVLASWLPGSRLGVIVDAMFGRGMR